MKKRAKRSLDLRPMERCTPYISESDSLSMSRHMNELARMQNTTLFKELKLAGLRISLSRSAAPSVGLYDSNDRVVGFVEPVIAGGRVWWMVEDVADGIVSVRYSNWEDVEEAIYAMVSRTKEGT